MERPKKSAVADGIPDDPLAEILSRLTIKELHRSKCVSKRWRDLIEDPFHRKKLPQTLHGFFPTYAGELGSYINLSGRTPPPIDPAFTFLKKQPGIHSIRLWGSCNGLLLFDHSTWESCNGVSLFDHTTWLRKLGYIVFNAATKQWAAVPSELTPGDRPIRLKHTCLVFDPTVSPHFGLVIIGQVDGSLSLARVLSYSSETGVWRHTQIDWAQEVKQLGHWNGCHPQINGAPSYAVVLNSMLYLLLTSNQIAEVDMEGKTKRIIPAPSSVGRRVRACHPFFIGQSQGRLYCINEEQGASHVPAELSNRVYTRDSNDDSNLMSIWVLKDYDTQKWTLKHCVSCKRLFGGDHYTAGVGGYNVVAIHPDNNNFVFIVLYREHRLISYGLNSKEVHTVGTFKRSLQFPPYVPCFLDFLSVAQHEENLAVDQRDKREEGEHAVGH